MKTILLFFFVLFLSYQVFSAPITKSTDIFCEISDEALNEYFKGKTEWSKNSLTWSIRSFPSIKQFSHSHARTIIKEAFLTWAEFIPITIEEACSTCKPDISIGFGPYELSNYFDFDKMSEESSDELNKNLFLIALHQIGHTLGLKHSDNSASIMYPRYLSASHSKDLPSLDIDSIQHLYGAKKGKTLLYQLIHVGSNKVLDIFRDQTNDGTNVQIFTSHHKANQLWAIYPNKDGTIKLINPQSGKALHVRENLEPNGANVEIFTENGSDAQKWTLTHIEKGIYKLIHKSSGKVLDVSGNGSNDGTNVQVWRDNDTTAQQWRLVPINL